MRHSSLSRPSRLGVILFSFFISLLPIGGALWAQQNEDGADTKIPSLPIDPSVRIGVLENGMTYILRRNEATEKGKANFYLVEKAGSLQEQAGEEGMARFVEKMAFSGTLHFSGHKLSDFLTKNGLISGKKVLTETGYDRTLYKIQDAPTSRQDFVDSLILVLRDWAGGMLLAPNRVEEERSLLLKSWDTWVTPKVEVEEKVISALLPPGHLYASRPPYGRKATLERVTAQSVTAFYRKWYRPQYQAVIVVGDIDLDKLEETIERTMGRLRGENETKEVGQTYIPELAAPKGAVIADPSNDRSTLTISWIGQALQPAIKSSAASLLKDYYVRLITLMLNERLKDLAFLPEPPFESAEISYGTYLGLATNEDALRLSALLITGADYREALKALVTEVKRAVEHGFEQGEFELAKGKIIEEYRLRFAKLKEISNKHFSDKYAQYFISGGYIPGIELEQKLISQIAEQVTLKGVNGNLQSIISGPNTSILLELPESGTGILTPTGAQLERYYRSYYDKATTPYKPTFAPKALMTKDPEHKGYLVSEGRDLKYGATRWRLSNGATIYLLPTKNSSGEVLIKGVADGGFSLADAQKNPIAVRAINEGILAQLGVGGHSPLALKKFVDNSTIRIKNSIRYDNDYIQAKAQKQDIEDLFRLLYLRLSRPQFSETDFSRAKKMELKHLRSKESLPSPDTVLGDSLHRAMYPDQKIFGQASERELNRFGLKDLEKVYLNHYGDARRFTFFIVGDFDPIELQPLVEKYLAVLPSDFEQGVEKSYVPKGLPSRSKYLHVTLDRSYPFAATTNLFVGSAKRTLKNILLYDLIADIIYQRYTKDQHAEGGLIPHDFDVRADVGRVIADGSSYVSFSLHSDPGHIDELSNMIIGCIKTLAYNGVETEEFRNAVLYLEDNHTKALSDNGYWTTALQSYFLNNEDLADSYLPVLKSITQEEVTSALRDLIDHNVLISVKVTSAGLPR